MRPEMVQGKVRRLRPPAHPLRALPALLLLARRLSVLTVRPYDEQRGLEHSPDERSGCDKKWMNRDMLM